MAGRPHNKGRVLRASRVRRLAGVKLPPPPPSLDVRRQAKFLYWMTWRVSDIAAYLGEPASTVASWKSRDEWDKAGILERMEAATEARYVALVLKDQKTGGDFKEIDLLGRQAQTFARVRRYEQPGGHEGDLNPKVANRNAKPKKKAARNTITADQVRQLRAAFEADLFGYQRKWLDAADQRTRVILKSRQIGATFYFAREAFIDALETGRNQIFLSASKAQAHVFRSYILNFVKQVLGPDFDLKGDPLALTVLDDDGVPKFDETPTLYFLGTNARTAQSYHGNLYFDEFFWVYGFAELEKVASGMATHKKWRKTYFSTPSSVGHGAYPFWTGALFNKRKSKAERVEIDVSWAALRDGQVGPDRKWRQIVTVADAEAQGCDLFDIEELRLEYSADDFANLFMCEFVDDALSVFPLAELQPCMVDAWEVWDDFAPLSPRPFGDRPVWIGYDPSLSGDSAALVVVAPPAVGLGKFRLLEKYQFRGMDFAKQAEAICKIGERYNVQYIGIDATGLGQGVYQLVLASSPIRPVAITYNAEVKNRLVLKAKDTITRRRFEFDAGATDVAASFMAIRKGLTGGGAATYEASRSEETGHADLAWAIMHALDNEPLDAVVATAGPRRSMMELSE